MPPPDHRHDEEVGGDGGGDDDSSGVSRDEENAGQRTEEEHEREEKEDVVSASPSGDGVGVVFFAQSTSDALQSASVFLVGIMGTGKTTVGKELARSLGYGYFDTDALIEQITKQKVHEISEEDGEGRFR